MALAALLKPIFEHITAPGDIIEDTLKFARCEHSQPKTTLTHYVLILEDYKSYKTDTIAFGLDFTKNIKFIE